jgi:hypothetical protein
MDPNNPDQKPGEPAPPPVWGPPAAPDQPGYGAPTSPWSAPPAPPSPDPWGAPPAQSGPEQPGWAAPPPAYGTPPPAYGAPQDQYGAPQPYGAPPAPYGAPPPTWGAPMPTTPAKGGKLKRILIACGVVVVILFGLGVAAALLSPSHDGQVIFTTDAPTSSGAASCQLGTQVTTVTAGTQVYANFFYKSRLTNETVTLTIIKDGTVLTTSTLPSDQTNGIDCLELSDNLSSLSPGVYEFKLTTANGDTVSDGTLTIK